MTLPPGSTVGILGSGQLGRMLALAARPLGYRVQVLAPDAHGSPAEAVCDRAVQADYSDSTALDEFARSCDVVTVEFENIPAAALERLAAVTRVHPGARALHVTQNRLREKEFLRNTGIPLAPFARIRNEAELAAAAEIIGLPAVLKTAGFGYDGKGQVLLRSQADFSLAGELLSAGEAVLEGFIGFEREVSVIAVRSVSGETGSYGLFSNRHSNHILDVTVAGEPAAAATESRARELAGKVLTALDYVGVMCVEMFEMPDGSLLVNEVAPRVHNSGHLTIEAGGASQFEQHIRAICGLPLGDFGLRTPAAMANLLGEEWSAGEPDWSAALADSRVHLHLYGKSAARPGRKMGHLTALAATASEAEQAVVAAREALRSTGTDSAG